MQSGEMGFKWNNATQGVIGQITKAHTTAGVADQTTAITDHPLGVLINQPKNGETAQIDSMNDGAIGLVLADGTTNIAINDPLKTNSTGRAVKATRGGSFVTTEAWIIGWALEACTAADKIIRFKKNIVEGSWT